MVRKALVGIAVLVSMVVWTSGPHPAHAVSWDVPDVAYIEGTLPANSFTDELPFTCISRQDPRWGVEDGWFFTAFCYTGDPPYSYVPGDTLFTMGNLRGRMTMEAAIDPDGAMTLPVADCVPFEPRLYVALVLDFQHIGDPGGHLALIEDDDVSGDCTGITPITTELTITGTYDRGNLEADYDGDGCLDYYELGYNAALGGLRDPFNDTDCQEVLNDSGVYSIWGILQPAGKLAGGDPDPGEYYYCVVDVEWTSDADITARPYCYVDIPGVRVNPEASEEEGDGLPGLPPPPPYGDVEVMHAQLSGPYDSGTHKINLSGCLADRDDAGDQGSVYTEWDIDVRGGSGTMKVWTDETLGDCLAGTHPPNPSGEGTLSVMGGVVGEDERETNDFDGDGCPDVNELSDDETEGGLRDPYNKWDYFEPTHNGQVRIDDVAAVINNYRADDPPNTNWVDRTGIEGGNLWNLGPPNGQIRMDDVLAVEYQYRHDCGSGDVRPPKPTTWW